MLYWYVRGRFVSCFFFFKQKTAYEMRISDWSSDVCSSDLAETGNDAEDADVAQGLGISIDDYHSVLADASSCRVLSLSGTSDEGLDAIDVADEIGRASCRERVCQYV